MSMSPHMSPHASHKGSRRQQHPARLRKHLKIDQTSANLPRMMSRIESRVSRAKRAEKQKHAPRAEKTNTRIQAEPPRPTQRKQRPTLTLLGSARESMLEHMLGKSDVKPHDEKFCRIRAPTLALNQKTGTMIMYVTSLKMILT